MYTKFDFLTQSDVKDRFRHSSIHADKAALLAHVEDEILHLQDGLARFQFGHRMVFTKPVPM